MNGPELILSVAFLNRAVRTALQLDRLRAESGVGCVFLGLCTHLDSGRFADRQIRLCQDNGWRFVCAGRCNDTGRTVGSRLIDCYDCVALSDGFDGRRRCARMATDNLAVVTAE